ncbi:MAG: DUF2059 domain-containing protein [Nitrospirales bacterium]
MKKALILILALTVFPACSNAQDRMEVRIAAAERYADTFDYESLFDNTVRNIALKLPEPERNTFTENMKSLDLSWIRQLAMESMVQVLSTRELEALAEFYGSEVGQSIMVKYPEYNAIFQPELQKRMVEEAHKALSMPQ